MEAVTCAGGLTVVERPQSHCAYDKWQECVYVVLR